MWRFGNALCCAVVIGGAACGSGARADDIAVFSPADLHAALSYAQAGDRLILASGEYGVLRLSGRQGITLLAGDGVRPARFSGLALSGVKALRLEGLRFVDDPPRGQDNHRPFVIDGSDDVTLRGVSFVGGNAHGTGTQADGYGAGIGLVIRGGRNVVVQSARFTTFYRGIIIAGGQGHQIIGSDISDIRSDGINILHARDILIDANHLHDFRRAFGTVDHADMIQMWTRGHDRPSTGIVLQNNRLDIGAGDHTQSIFLRNEAVDDEGRDGMAYRDVRIIGNRIRNAHSHGITVGRTKGLIIRDNILTPAPRRGQSAIAASHIPRIRIDPLSTEVEVTGNIAPPIKAPSTGWQIDQGQ